VQQQREVMSEQAKGFDDGGKKNRASEMEKQGNGITALESRTAGGGVVTTADTAYNLAQLR
jgi:hypothetical protein